MSLIRAVAGVGLLGIAIFAGSRERRPIPRGQWDSLYERLHATEDRLLSCKAERRRALDLANTAYLKLQRCQGADHL